MATPIIIMDTEVSIEQHRYMNNNRIALVLVEKESGEPFADVSINISEQPLEENEIIVKTYEVEELFPVLRAHNVISEPKRWIQAGYVNVPVVDFHPESEWT